MTTVADEKIAKITRFLHGVMERSLKGSLNIDEFILVNQNLLGKHGRASNLVEYAGANCPKIDWYETTNSKTGRLRGSVRLFNEEAFYQRGPHLWVNPDLEQHVGLQLRPTRVAPLSFQDFEEPTDNSELFGRPGTEQREGILRNAADLGQISRMITAQQDAQEGPLLLNQTNIFPVIGKEGVLNIVIVFHTGNHHTWCISGFPLVEEGACKEGSRVFLNQ